MHWSDRYIGQPYLPETGDCAALAEKVANEVLGITPNLPTAHAVTYRAQARQVESVKDDYADRVDSPIDGHPVLLIARARPCHIGVMCRITSDWWVLHADQTSGYVIRQREREITRLFYKIEGYYRWK